MLSLLALITFAEAKDLNGRLGVGAQQALGGLSTLSVRYGFPTGNPTLNIGLGVEAGLDATVGATPDYYGGARLYFGVVAEDNMNLYLGAAAGYGTRSGSAAIRLSPSLHAEFFLFGLDNLGLMAGMGINVHIGSSTQLSTWGSPSVGFHYYF